MKRDDFETEDDWFEYRMANDPAFLERIEKARAKIKEGKGISWETIKKEMRE